MTTIDSIIGEIENRLNQFTWDTRFQRAGVILEVRDGVVSILGLGRAQMGEEVIFPKSGLAGQVIGLEEDKVWAIVLGDHNKISQNEAVKATGEVFKIGISESILGRVINPLIIPLDDGRPIKQNKFLPIEKIAPGVIFRIPVNTPLRTGIKVVDSLIPIGRGQRELIIGDRSTGKTSLALDTIINQKDVICIYVAIGQKQSSVAQIASKLKEVGAMENVVVVSATSADPPSLQYIAPYVGCTIGEYFMEMGRDVLVVYDDLIKHAWAYRQISLILRKPSGREAYPGDIFYLHSRLLERACRLTKAYGGGSLTALPIVETHGGDISTYIPTNIISITDGQIYLETDLFYSGVRPAVNVGLSVSRVGGAAQTKKVKDIAGPLRLELAQYRELSAFAQFGSDLDRATRDKLDRGARIVELLKQPQYSPVSEEELVIVLFIATSGLVDDIPVDKCSEFAEKLLEYLKIGAKKQVESIKDAPILSDTLKNSIRNAVEKFKKTWQS